MESRLMVLIKMMHKKFQLNNEGEPCLLSDEEKQFRCKALQEELDEYKNANSLVDQYDALLDLIVFAIGTLERQGLPLLEGFDAVMKANLNKEIGINAKRGNFQRDLVKPQNWVGPEVKLQKIIDAKKQKNNFIKDKAPKFDEGKVRFDLIPVYPITEIAKTFNYGATKYFRDSYRTGEPIEWSRTFASILRHLYAFWSGVDTDEESNMLHLAHAATQTMILLEHSKFNKEKDDRFLRG